MSVIRFSLLVCLFVGASHAGDLEHETAAPDLVPADWVADYDYTSDLGGYLRGKYEVARDQGKSAYVYFYSNSGEHCKYVRKVLARRSIKSVLDDVLMVMLDFDHYEAQHNQEEEGPFALGNWHPVILKVSSNGQLTVPAFHPDVYLFHPTLIPERRLRKNAIKK